MWFPLKKTDGTEVGAMVMYHEASKIVKPKMDYLKALKICGCVGEMLGLYGFVRILLVGLVLFMWDSLQVPRV